MKNTINNLRIRVVDKKYKGIDNASVVLQSQRKTFYLNCLDEKGNYVSENNIPKGEYIVIISKKPFDEERRKISFKGGKHEELFILFENNTPFYYRGKVKTPFTPYKNEIVVVIEEEPEKPKSKTRIDKKHVLTTLVKKYKLSIEEQGENIENNGFYIIKYSSKTSEKEKLEVRKAFEKESLITAPLLHLSENNASALTNEIMVKFEDYVTKDTIEELAKKFKLKIKRKMSVLGNLYHFTTGTTPTYEVLKIANEIAELENVIFSEPNLMHTTEEDAVTPTDFLYPEQWDHQILNTPDAWQFLRNINTNRTFGNANVIIGVVDSGVDPNHPEFSGNVSNGNSKTYQAFDFGNMVANNNTLTSDHGTCCASAAAANANNATAVTGINEGVAGVAGNCRVLAIKRGGDEARYADMYLWAAGFDPESDTANFPAQITPGADVITNSFGFSTGSPISGTMSAVFDKLTDDGRNGLGTLLFFSAGNANSDIDITFARPWGMYSKCFSVSASTLANDGVTETRAGYSSFGSVVEFCAPSHDAYVSSQPLHNPTTNYGAFTATRMGNPNTKDVAVGRPSVQNTLSANATSGSNSITVNNSAGFNVGQAIMINNPGSGNAETHSITAVNNAGKQLTLDGNLFNNHPTGTTVFATQADYRNNFGGTSHATPLCAGVAALILSANPQLTWTEVRDLMRNTAVKINPGESNANGRWQDINGNFSNSGTYDGNPIFSEFYGFGRIDAARVVREAGWDIELVTTNLNFNDVPEGEEVARAIRFNVRSLWSTNFNMTNPGTPFDTPYGTSENLGTSSDASIVREVYLWVTYRGTTDGDEITMADGYSVTVTNPETEQEWIIPITANTIGRKTSAIMLCLDQSGSMDFPSGIDSSKRIDVLRFSASILADVIQQGNGLGIVSFDQDPHDILIPLVGPLGPVSPFDVDRTNIKSAITTFSPNLNGSTAIGDGLERAQLRLNPITNYDTKSVIVLTDGKETDSKYIADVSGSINDRVFAIGLGKAENIEPSALNAVVNSSGGYLLLTDALNNNSIFKLAKYFLQILAGVNNEEVVVDPDGELFLGQEHKIPFVINEADISSDVILMLPNPQMIDFALESPNGHIIKPSDSTTIPGLTFNYGNNVSYYRMTMPLPIGAGERDGKWHAILKVNEKYYHKYKNRSLTHINYEEEYQSSGTNISKGIPYSLLVHAFSNLKMKVDISQDGFEQGATIKLKVILTQYGIPLPNNVFVSAILTPPNGIKKTVTFIKGDIGEYNLDLKTQTSGIYQFRIIAKGTTLRGRDFTREQVRTGAVWVGGNNPAPESNRSNKDKQELCKLLSCLLSEKNFSTEFKARMVKQGIHVDGMIKCLKAYCNKSNSTKLNVNTLESLKLQYTTLMDSYNEIINEI
ncbi:S8 family serine peptidase [Aureibaculum luteum]|uniref:S8 family serine peptidase n=1 Tax=Aureibaculum luteum TaxID=1548456 RepID=UPI000E54BE9B|nr:S8 family serine peptidase [Aureibaculum luteum]